MFKHIILARLVTYLQRKSAGFRYIDTHAGRGLYDLTADEAHRTHEADGGIHAFWAGLDSAPDAVASLLHPYVHALELARTRFGDLAYPGSPRVVHELRRSQDKIVAIEKNQLEFVKLRDGFVGAHGITTLHLDGYTGLKSQLPPKERRGLILIDPPFELRTEFDDILKGLREALKRFQSGTYAIWYPLKNQAAVTSFKNGLRTLTDDLLIVEIEVGPKSNADGKAMFYGCGMVILKAPYVLSDELEQIMPWLTGVLGRSATDANFRIESLR